MFLEIVDLDLNVMAALTLTEEGYVQVCCLWDIVLRAVVQQLITPPPQPPTPTSSVFHHRIAELLGSSNLSVKEGHFWGAF